MKVLEAITATQDALKSGIAENIIRIALAGNGWQAQKIDTIMRWAKLKNSAKD